MRASRLKIVHITTVHDPFDTRIFEKMCKSLVERGHNVQLIARYPRRETVEGIEIIPLRRRRGRLQRATFGVSEAVRLARKLNPDVFHLHDPELLVGARILRSTGPVIYDMHEYVPASIQHKEWLNRGLRGAVYTIWRILERPLLKGLSVIFAERSYSKHYDWLEDTEVVLNLPRVEQLFSVGCLDRRADRVVYMGSVTAERGSMNMLEALRILQSRGVDVEFVCIGPISARHEGELRGYVRKHNVNRVNFKGRLRAEEAWRLAATGRVALATVLPLPNYVESYPTKLFEYMALAIPVVASAFPLYRDVIDRHECGFCVDPEDPVAIADAIGTLLSQPRLAELMGQRGRIAVTDYSWEPEMDKLERLYRRLAVEAK